MHDHATPADKGLTQETPLTFWRVVGILVLGFGAAGAIDRWVERTETVTARAAPDCHRPFICGNSGECYPILGVPEPEICVYLAAHRGY